MIDRAVEILRAGGVVAFPTETVYGLGADATRADAVRRIYSLKGRPNTNPCIIHVASIERARAFAEDWNESAQRLAERFWPGPLTLVLRKRTPADLLAPRVVDEATAGLATAGFRVPAHPVALRLLKAFGRPIAAPSANKSSHVSPTTARHVRDEFGDEIELILDGGACQVGIESTVLDLSAAPPRILRPGHVAREQIELLIGPVDYVPGKVSSSAAPSPGLLERHYAPRTPAFRFEPADRDRIDVTNAAIVELTLDPESYARGFYAKLRMLDQQNLDAIYIEMPPDTPAWAAVRDRIIRATRPV